MAGMIFKTRSKNIVLKSLLIPFRKKLRAVMETDAQRARSRTTDVVPNLFKRSIRPNVIVTNQQNAAFLEKQDSKGHKIFLK